MDEANIIKNCDKIDKLFINEDWSLITVFAEKNSFEKFENYIKSKQCLINNLDSLTRSLHSLLRVGIAYFKLEKFKKAQEKFEAVNKILENIDNLIIDIERIPREEFNDNYQSLKNAFEKFFIMNRTLKVDVMSYIADVYLKKSENINSIHYFMKTLRIAKKRKEDIIFLRIGLSEAVYEFTKKCHNLLKFILRLMVICVILFALSFLFNIFKDICWHIFILIIAIIIVLSPFKSLNYILDRLGKIITFKIHDKSRKIIEALGKKNFDTHFAICKLYYYLGEYQNSIFYAQLALSASTLQKPNNYLALVYNYLARIAYKTGNHSMAIVFYDKAIENILGIEQNIESKEQESHLVEKIKNKFKKPQVVNIEDSGVIHSIPKLSEVIKYAQQNRDILEKKAVSRVYLPLIITIIFMSIISGAQIYSGIHPQQTKDTVKHYKLLYQKILSEQSKSNNQKLNINKKENINYYTQLQNKSEKKQSSTKLIIDKGKL